MKPGVSSKHITKYSDEERGKNKKLKSDKKRRRRRRDSTPSSSSSGSEDDSRALRKSSRREPKRSRRPASSRGDDPSHPRKRRKEPKKPDKRKGRNSRRRRDASVSSTGGSSRSCSTCRGRSSSTARSRSRSRSPLRADRKSKSRVRGRSKGRDSGRRSGYRVCSRSSCSGCSSSSHSRSHFEKKHREKDGSRSLRTKASGETEGRYEDRDKIIQAYDDFRPSRSNDGYEVWRKPEGMTSASEKNARNARDEDGAYKKGEEVILSKANTQLGKNSNDRGDHSFGREIGSTKNPSEGKNSEVIATTGSSEAEDLELILRQKALENFKKFRGGIPPSTLFLGDQKDEAAGTESCQDAGRAVEVTPPHRTAKSSVKSLICKPDSSTENYRSTQGGDRPIKVRVKSVANPVAHRSDDHASSIPASEGQITHNQLTRVHDSSKEIYAEKVSLAKVIQDRQADAEPGSSNNCGFEGNRADGSASGSQFEERTFSRVHDGEMVQVSYKVYIPKKSPALARRQLQQ